MHIGERFESRLDPRVLRTNMTVITCGTYDLLSMAYKVDTVTADYRSQYHHRGSALLHCELILAVPDYHRGINTGYTSEIVGVAAIISCSCRTRCARTETGTPIIFHKSGDEKRAWLQWLAGKPTSAGALPTGLNR